MMTTSQPAPQAAQPVGTRFSAIVVKPFTLGPGIALSPEFLSAFSTAFVAQLTKAQVTGRVLLDGAALSDAELASAGVLEGRVIENTQGGMISPGIIGSEIKLSRRSDQGLITTLTARAPYKSSPFNTDTIIGKGTGTRTADEVVKVLR